MISTIEILRLILRRIKKPGKNRKKKNASRHMKNR